MHASTCLKVNHIHMRAGQVRAILLTKAFVRDKAARGRVAKLDQSRTGAACVLEPRAAEAVKQQGERGGGSLEHRWHRGCFPRTGVGGRVKKKRGEERRGCL